MIPHVDQLNVACDEIHRKPFKPFTSQAFEKTFELFVWGKYKCSKPK